MGHCELPYLSRWGGSLSELEWLDALWLKQFTYNNLKFLLGVRPRIECKDIQTWHCPTLLMTLVEGTPLTLRKMTISSGYTECQVKGSHRKLPCFVGGDGRGGWDVYRKREDV